MTSKYQFQVKIYRNIDKDMLLKLVKDLENGVILEFPGTFNATTNGYFSLNITATGYWDLKDNKKIIKLTNLQRREFISESIKCLKYPKLGDEELTTLKISMNEYTASLPVAIKNIL
jgi:hypothetical protein